METRPFLVRLAALLMFFGNAVQAGIMIDNFEDRDVVRHPVILVRGKVEGERPLAVKLSAAGGSAVTSSALVGGGRFKALVELLPGDNLLEFSSDSAGLPVRLKVTLNAPTDPHYVRLIWLTDKSGATDYATPEDGMPQDYEARMRTAGLLLQCFTAERMHELGYGRRTFRLETDRAGKIVVHTIKAPQDAAHYQEMSDGNQFWGEVNHFLNSRYPDPNAKNLVLAAFTRKDPATGKMMAHTALGGGNLGLFGSASVFSWPSEISGVQAAFLDSRKVDPARVHDDSAGRGTWWAVASTTLGATLHEMSHSFGLPHCKDPRCIMTRGFDRLNRFFTLAEAKTDREPEAFPPDGEAWFAPVSAAFLRWSPWFQPDPPRRSGNGNPAIEREARKDGVEFSSRAGVRAVGFWEGDDIRTFREMPVKAPNRIKFTAKEIGEIMEGRPVSRFTLIDSNGATAELKAKQ